MEVNVKTIVEAIEKSADVGARVRIIMALAHGLMVEKNCDYFDVEPSPGQPQDGQTFYFLAIRGPKAIRLAPIIGGLMRELERDGRTTIHPGGIGLRGDTQ